MNKKTRKVDPAPPTVKKSVTLDQLITILYTRKGCAFASVNVEYDMDEKMKVRGNPFHGKGLRKLAKTDVMVTFDYEKSMENRGDKASGKGNWSMAVTREDGSLTPLSVHKADILAPQQPGEPMRLKENPRCYLRCEFRKSDSKIVDANGQIVDKASIKPHLKKQSNKGVVDFHLVTLHKVTKMRLDNEEYIII